MKFEQNNRYTQIAMYACLVIFAGILFYLGVTNIGRLLSIAGTFVGYLTGVIYGAVIAYFLRPLVNLFENKLLLPFYGKKIRRGKTRRGFSILATYITVFVALGMIVYIIVPQLGDSIKALMQNLNSYAASAQQWSRSVIEWISQTGFISPDQLEQIYADIQAALTSWIDVVTQSIPAILQFISAATVATGNVFLGFVIAIYLLASKEKHAKQGRQILYALFSRHAANETLRIARMADRIFGGYMVGTFLSSGILAVVTFVFCLIWQIPYAALITIIVGVFNIIPYFGPIVSAVICVLLLLIIDPIKAVWFAIYIIVMQQVEGNVIAPKILGDSTGLSAFFVIVAILIGGGLWGYVGMFIAVPAFAVIYALFKEFVGARLKAKGIADDFEPRPKPTDPK